MRKMIKLLYILTIKLLDRMYQPAVKRNNVVVMMTFTEDTLPLIDRLLQLDVNLTVLYHPKHQQLMNDYTNILAIPLSNKHIIQQIIAIKSAKTVVIDTYYLMLGSLVKNEQQEVIQLWHAVCALKTFGLKDRSVDLNNQQTVEQYQSVYHFTDSYVVAGSAMEQVFKDYLDAEHKKFLKFGLPRLEKKYSSEEIERVTAELWSEQQIKILFVPTYRDYLLEPDQQLKPQHIDGLVIKAHPSDHNYQSMTNVETNLLIACADIVITDYSSLAVEAAYHHKPVLFFVPDEARYRQERGLNEHYDQLSFNTKAETLLELKDLIKSPQHLPVEQWVNYQHDALHRLTEYLKERMR